MDLRKICQEREYDIVIGTTYSFDPLFFEKVILPDIRFGQGRNILLIGDGIQLIEAINSCNTQLREIGNTIVSEPVYLSGAFHPKILLKIGKAGVIFTIGSGNMTSSGWGDNYEIFSKWVLPKDDPRAGLIVKQVISSLSPYINSEIAHQTLNKCLDNNWYIDENNNDKDFDFIITKPDESLSQSVMKKWSNKHFHTLRLFTGSTDQNGAFIEWCHNTFGIKTCIVSANEDRISFDKTILNKIPVDISIAPVDSNDMMHAKFYLFEGDDGYSAIMGSANCSRQAWLLSPNDGGNVEAIALYDNIDINDFYDIVQKFPDRTIPINELKVNATDSEYKRNQIKSVKIASLSLDRFSTELVLELVNKLSDKSKITLSINGVTYPLSINKNDNKIWNSYLVDIPENKYNTTLFADVFIEIPGEHSLSLHHWVNDIAKIKSASKSRRINDATNNLFNANNNSEYNNALKELAYINNTILEDSSPFEDPYIQKQNKKDGTDIEKENIKPLTSESLYKSLSEIQNGSPQDGIVGGRLNTSLSLAGIINFFFSFQDEMENYDLAEDEENDFDGQKESKNNKSDNGGKDKQEKRIIDARFKQKLVKQIDQYLIGLGSESFRDHCTATQLKQAAAYPLVITVFGKRHGWVEEEQAERWVTTTIDILLKMIIETHNGILDSVEGKFLKSGKINIFNEVLGDGTLWVALLTAIDEIEWSGEYGFMNRAFAISAVANHKALLSSTNPGQMNELINKHKFKQTAAWIKNKPIGLVRSLNKINKYLNNNFDLLMGDQLEKNHIQGDLLFSPNIGWGIVLDEKVIIYSSARGMNVYLHKRGKKTKVMSHGYFINLRIAQENDQKLSKLLNNLKS